MKLSDCYQGNRDPFEGDRTLWLRILPDGTRVIKATVTLALPEKWAQSGFQETFVFPSNTVEEDELSAEDWGVTKTELDSFVEVDFHARRTLAEVAGSGVFSALFADMGGAYVNVTGDGTFNPEDLWGNTLSSDGVALPGLTVNKFKLKGNNLQVSQVTIRSVPTNVSVRLGQMPPFWTHLGEMATSQTSPDFADVLNMFLAEASAENGFYAIPFVVHSDTIARLDVTLAIDYVVEQPVLPSYLPEVTLPYGYSSLPGIEEDLLTVKLPRGAKPVSGTSAMVLGTFDASRVVSGEIGESGATATITVSADRSLAQPIQLGEETPVSGIDLPLANTQPGFAGLHLDLQEDADGKPSGEVLTSAGVTVGKPVPGGSSWGSAALPEEFRFERGKRYWLVLQSVSGEAHWDAQPGDTATPALQASTNGGLSWRTAASDKGEKPLKAIFRLRHTPEQFTMPIQLQIGKGPEAVRVKFDRFAPLGRVEFDADFITELEEFVSSPAAASPCGTGNLLVNSDFSNPPPDDATRKLFGFDAEKVSYPSTQITGTVDLSRGVDLSIERFITLTVNGLEPKLIDCAGAIPARTQIDEVVTAINQVISGVAKKTDDNRLIITGSSSVELHPWCRPQVPHGWQGIPGQVLRHKHPETGQVLTVLVATRFFITDGQGEQLLPHFCFLADPDTLQALTGEPVELSQRILVRGTCFYLLKVRFYIYPQLLDLNEQPPALLQIEWLDAEGTIISTDQAKIKTPFDEEPSGNNKNTIIAPPWLHETRVKSPLTAAQAEIRLIQQSPGILVLEEVSFSPTLELLQNANFRQWEGESNNMSAMSPVDWMCLGGWFDRQPGQPGGVILKGTGSDGALGPGDTVLAQIAEVVAGECYELQVCAQPLKTSATDPETLPDEQRARLELRWLKNESEIGESVILLLDGRNFPKHAWAGTAPDGVAQAEIRLIQPRGQGDLLVESVSLSRIDMLSVPLIFLAEAPGELKVSDLRVTYDPPGPPPERKPLQPTTLVTQPKRVVTGIPQPPAVEEVEEPAPSPPLRSLFADRPINDVAGIGDRFSEILRSLSTPITTIEELAAVDSEMEIERIPFKRLLDLKATAEMIMAIKIETASFVSLADESLETLLTLSSDELARRAGQRPEHAVQFQRDLRALRLLLKNEVFDNMRLSDLMAQ